MSIVLPVLFATAGLIAVASIWNTIVANAQAIHALYARVTMPDYGCAVEVNLREPELALDPVATMRRARAMRHPAPKPITHRLHHFIKARDVA